MIGVVDTSALIRLFVPDGLLPNGFEEFLRGVERGLNTAIAPELLLAEAANVINKMRKSGEIDDSEGDRLLDDLLLVPVRLLSHRPVILRSFDLARQYGVSIYDTLYLALAENHGAVIFSADRKLLKIAIQLKLQ